MFIIISSGKCEDLIIPLCSSSSSSLEYNLTRLPNMFGHSSQLVAALEVQQFIGLVKSSCSPFLSSFLCVAYAPPCTGASKPCKTLCEKVVSSCQELLSKFGFALPEAFNCSTYPDEKVANCYHGNIVSSTTSIPVDTTEGKLYNSC